MKNKIKINRHQKIYLILLLLLSSFYFNDAVAQDKCNLVLPSLRFQSSSTSITNTAKAVLQAVATKLKESPFCSITFTSYPPPSKSGQSICQKRTYMLKTYLIEKEGISADRISTNCVVGGGDPNIVDVTSN
jgi:hypothetical protein